MRDLNEEYAVESYYKYHNKCSTSYFSGSHEYILIKHHNSDRCEDNCIYDSNNYNDNSRECKNPTHFCICGGNSCLIVWDACDGGKIQIIHDKYVEQGTKIIHKYSRTYKR
jgi:hypothetical protein